MISWRSTLREAACASNATWRFDKLSFVGLRKSCPHYSVISAPLWFDYSRLQLPPAADWR
ncbi:hypothetical protein H6G74_26245 [Nostoc spongiaeforme FACHB-130]|uniref:Uncharacterized protein n=1 Tax=Nostoc spongiaeforme FACHB-130 TaxID=1357510 RepID=A0ABR8G3H5_9NOSO|nr:hypothetical protein [Nostoc spongiaeforme]MBD2597798.1 hypothetical protein [Nostoc spongiaeforme FACHB-130]